MITIEKIKLFDRYGGDVDSFAKGGHDYEKGLFNNKDWSIIEGFYQDIELINNQLAAPSYIEQALQNLKDKSDVEGFKKLCDKIVFYRSFQKIVDILQQIKSHITGSTDTAWSGFDSPEQFIDELHKDIEGIKNCDFLTLKKVHVEFLPTSTYQELSISNGWEDDYMSLSTDFDRLYKSLHKKHLRALYQK